MNRIEIRKLDTKLYGVKVKLSTGFDSVNVYRTYDGALEVYYRAVETHGAEAVSLHVGTIDWREVEPL